MKLLLPILLLASFALGLSDETEAHPFGPPRGTPQMRRKTHIAHGIVINLATIVVFPIGGILLRWCKTSPRAIRFHMIFQIAGVFMLLWGLGLGAWVAYLEDNVTRSFFQNLF